MVAYNLAVVSFEIASDWKSSFIKLTFLLRLTRLQRQISLAHQAIELLFSLAQEQNVLALGNRTCVFSCPELM